jgi:prolyl-tRNA editing enzyme YbaK/EbsC (Cys-tRNA(Pro) deacylase)
MKELLLPQTAAALDAAGLEYRAIACDPSLADTAAFCEHYGFGLDQSANAILVASRTEPTQYVCCVVLATTKLDVNKAVCKLMGVKKASFASAEQTRELTGMEIGGVTPFGIPGELPTYVDAAVMEQDEVVMGGGNRSSKVVISPLELAKFPGVQTIDNLAKPKE